MDLKLYKVVNKLNSLFSSIVLRILALIGYVSPSLMRLIKLLLAKYVMRAIYPVAEIVNLRISYNEQITKVTVTTDKDLIACSSGTPKHMASANYLFKT